MKSRLFKEIQSEIFYFFSRSYIRLAIRFVDISDVNESQDKLKEQRVWKKKVVLHWNIFAPLNLCFCVSCDLVILYVCRKESLPFQFPPLKLLTIIQRI
jgi:hypothetical protein